MTLYYNTLPEIRVTKMDQTAYRSMQLPYLHNPENLKLHKYQTLLANARKVMKLICTAFTHKNSITDESMVTSLTYNQVPALSRRYIRRCLKPLRSASKRKDHSKEFIDQVKSHLPYIQRRYKERAQTTMTTCPSCQLPFQRMHSHINSTRFSEIRAFIQQVKNPPLLPSDTSSTSSTSTSQDIVLPNAPSQPTSPSSIHQTSIRRQMLWIMKINPSSLKKIQSIQP